MLNTAHLPRRPRDFVGVILASVMIGNLSDERRKAIYEEVTASWDGALTGEGQVIQ